jgi:SEC-C motif-containing protein
VDYIAATMKGKAALGFDKLQAKQWASSVQWLGLNVISIPKSGQKDQGFVEFAARFKQDGKLQFIHEFSEFSLTNGQWFYVDGKPGKAPGRNDSCLCGSGKKFKKCCGG